MIPPSNARRCLVFASHGSQRTLPGRSRRQIAISASVTASATVRRSVCGTSRDITTAHQALLASRCTRGRVPTSASRQITRANSETALEAFSGPLSSLACR